MTSKSEGQTYAGLENCATNAHRASSGAKNLSDMSDFLSSHIWPQQVNLQVFSRVGKTVKKLYKFQMQPRTPAYLQYFDVGIYAGVKSALSTHGLGNI